MVSKEELFKSSDILLKVRPPLESETAQIHEGTTLLSLLYPVQNKDLVEKLGQRKITSFAMDCIPRISRAQTYDVLRYEFQHFHHGLVNSNVCLVALWRILLVIKPF